MKFRGPEKQVEKEVLLWARANGFDLTVVDTAAQFSETSQKYRKNMTASESLPDLIGNWRWLSVWIELKAPGSRSGINHPKSRHQRAFLMRKIEQGCFACVTDSALHLSQLWLKYKGSKNRQQVLIDDLPMLSFRRGSETKGQSAVPAK